MSNKKTSNITFETALKQLEDILGLKIKIIDKNGSGKISFIYKNLDQLENLIKKIRK